MTAIAPSVVKARIEALFAELGVTVLTGEEEDLSGTVFPAMEVKGSEGTRERAGLAGGYITSRTFEIVFFVLPITHPHANDTVRAANDLVEPYLESIPAYFIARPQLELDGVPLVFASRPMSDRDVLTITYKGAEYVGTVFNLWVRVSG